MNEKEKKGSIHGERKEFPDESELTSLMFKAIAESLELRKLLKKMKSEGKITKKSLLTFCLRPHSLLEEQSIARIVDEKEKESKPELLDPLRKEEESVAANQKEKQFDEEAWLKELRLKNPFI